MASRAQLFIGRLPTDVRERDVQQLFEKYGRLLRCDVKYGMYGSSGRRGSGRTGMAYAFVDYDDRRDAEDAIKYENGREMRGQSIVVEWARGPSYRSQGGSSGYQRSSSSNYNRSSSYQMSPWQTSEECYRCQRTGHWARDCPELERDNRYYPRSRNRSRSRSRSRSFRRRRSVSRSRSKSRDRRRSISLDKRRSISLDKRRSISLDKRRSISTDKRTKARSPSRSLTKSPSPSRSRSREMPKKVDKSSRAKKRDASKSPSKSRSPSRSRSLSRSPAPARNSNEGNHQSSDGGRFRERMSPSPRKSISRSVSKEKNRESDDGGRYRSVSRSKSR